MTHNQAVCQNIMTLVQGVLQLFAHKVVLLYKMPKLEWSISENYTMEFPKKLTRSAMPHNQAVGQIA